MQAAGTRIVLNVKRAVDRRSGRAAAVESLFGMAARSGRLLTFRHNSATAASSFVVASFTVIVTFADASSSAIALSSCYP